MLLTLSLLFAAAAIIYLSCELFVNGVEWVGRRLSVGRHATATVLAAFGAALPESVVTLVAVVFGKTSEQKALGIGAALGGPLVLATIAYGVVGLSLILARKPLLTHGVLKGEFASLIRDQRLFLIIFAAKIGLGLIAFSGKPWLAIPFLIAYLAYVLVEMRSKSHELDDEGEFLEPLVFAKGRFAAQSDNPPLWLAAVQTLLALGLIFAGSHLFVHQMEPLGPALGLSASLTALLLSPIATELPETLNAVIWVRQGKPKLALANISGSMMIQATVPTALGIGFTAWRLDPPLLVAAGVTAVAILAMIGAFMLGKVTRGLFAAMSLFYLAFAVIVFGLHI